MPYQVQYALRAGPADKVLWIEDIGRWFAGADGKPERAHGVVRVINERHDREERLTYLSRFDGLTGEMNRFHLTESWRTTLKQARGARTSCGFLLVADRQSRRASTKSYGFDVADEAIGAVAKRLRAKMRGGDQLGRFSGNKFGIILNNCTPDDMEKAAERLVAGVRDDVVRDRRRSGGGDRDHRRRDRAAPCPQRAGDPGARAGNARPRQGQAAGLVPGLSAQSSSARRCAATMCAPPTRSSPRSTSGASCWPSSRWSSAQTRQPAFYECLMRIRRADGTLAPAQRRDPGGGAARPGAPARSSRARTAGQRDGGGAGAAAPASMSRRPRPPIPTGGRRSGAMLRANAGVAERLIVEITETAAIHDIDDTRGFVARVKDLGCRIAIDDFGAGYTSFRNLRKLGVDILKIDGAFVQNLMRIGGRPRLRADAGRSRQAARPQDRRRMGAGRACGGAARGLGLRLPARRADRARLDRAALGRRGSGRPAQDHASI